MLIDGFTVAAQTVNFLILVWLLRRYLYRPILGAMTARQERIAARIRDAEQRDAAAARAQEQIASERAALEHDRQGLIERASADAAALRSQLTQDARTEVEGLRKKWSDQLQRDQLEMRDEISRAIRGETLALARSLLAQLAGRDLERHVIDEFERRLRALPSADRDAMASLANSEAPVVRTAFALDDAGRRDLDAAIRDALGAAQPCRFEQADDLVCGIEVICGGHKLAWSIDDALSDLENGARESDAADRGGAPP